MRKTTVEDCQQLSVRHLGSKLLAYGESVIVNGQTILLASTECSYGGRRYWFLCPSCDRRVGSLYKPLADALLECRTCKGLIYELALYRKSKSEKLIKLVHRLNKNLFMVS